MDDVERKVSLFGVGIALVIAIIWAVEWVKKTPVKTTQKFVKGKTCPAAYPKHVGQFCEHILKASDSYWATRFLFVFVVALFLLFFTLRRKRAGVACFSFFLGLGLGVAGVVFVFLGAWLVVRAFRLQRYGEASWSGSNRAAKEIAQAKREGRVATRSLRPNRFPRPVPSHHPPRPSVTPQSRNRASVEPCQNSVLIIQPSGAAHRASESYAI